MPCSTRRLGVRAVLLGVSILVCAETGAQIVTVELSYSNPGARSMGLGGAFVALADDATAAFVNPSGLVQLVRPEVSAEGRFWSYTTPYTAGGRASGAPSGIGIDTEPGLRIGTSHDDITGVSFLSVVYPKGDWRLAVYRHQLANFEMANQVNGLFAAPPGTGGLTPGFAGTIRDEDQRTTVDLEIVSYGLAAAYRVTDSLSLGLGLSYSDGSMRAITDEYLPDDPSMDAYFEANSYLAQRVQDRVTGSLSGTDWHLSAGVLWRPARRWSLGGFYRQGPELDLEFGLSPGPAAPGSPAGTLPSPVSFPDVFGLGAAFRTAEGRLTVALEWDRVEYSEILDSLAPELVAPVGGVVEPGTRLDDGSEIHLGAEYVLPAATPVIAVRAGVWRDPAHRIHYDGELAFDRALLQPGDDEIHVALGVGLAFARFQIDVGADLSDPRDTASLSAIYKF